MQSGDTLLEPIRGAIRDVYGWVFTCLFGKGEEKVRICCADCIWDVCYLSTNLF